MDRDTSFAHLIKQHRKVLDLTQAELARRVGCATITLRPFTAFSTGGAAVGLSRPLSRAPGVSVGCVSSGLRSARMTLPSVDARAMRSASCGVTANVTTAVGIGLPSLACS